MGSYLRETLTQLLKTVVGQGEACDLVGGREGGGEGGREGGRERGRERGSYMFCLSVYGEDTPLKGLAQSSSPLGLAPGASLPVCRNTTHITHIHQPLQGDYITHIHHPALQGD